MTFLKVYLGKFCQKSFFSYFSQLLLMSSLFNIGNFCEIENDIYIDAMVEMVYFLESFFILQNNYYFFRIIFGHLFSVYFADAVSILVFHIFLKTLKTSTHDFHDDVIN